MKTVALLLKLRFFADLDITFHKILDFIFLFHFDYEE